MASYDFKCDCGGTQTVVQQIGHVGVVHCRACGMPMKRDYKGEGAGTVFKGSGWARRSS